MLDFKFPGDISDQVTVTYNTYMYTITTPPLTFQGSVISQSTIDQAYNELLRQTEEFLVELKSRQEQQRVEEEEAEKMRKIKEEQVSRTLC